MSPPHTEQTFYLTIDLS